jgi:hypothetical protein
MAMSVGFGVLTSIGATLAMFSIYWQIEGFAGLVQPGQWLLVKFAFSAVQSMLAAALLMAWPINEVQFWYMIISGVGALVTLLIDGWCAWRVADTVLWRALFLVMVLATLLSSGLMFQLTSSFSDIKIQTVIFASHIGSSALVLLIECSAVLSDLRSERHRFWNHWVGVGLSMLAQFVAITGTVAFMLYLP